MEHRPVDRLPTVEEGIAGRAAARTFVGLLAAGGSVARHRRFGHAVHEDMTGMFRVAPRRGS